MGANKEWTDQSPSDYLLFYKRATAYMSLSRHPSALEDFDRVLSLTSGSFSQAYLSKAKIHSKEGRWGDAREALSLYSRTHPSSSGERGEEVEELRRDLEEGEAASRKAEGAVKAQLWEACLEAATRALRVASHSVHLRQARVECAMAGGDVEGAVGDLT
jgi:DnaJ family protein C protein 3